MPMPKGYKKKTDTKSPGSRSHVFAKLFKSLGNNQNYVSDLEINLQKVSNKLQCSRFYLM